MARIITVDDQASVRAILRRLLEREGHLVFEASDGRVLMDMLDGDVDLIITDMLMPEVDGIEVIRHVKGRYPAIPVLVVTGGWSNEKIDLRDVARGLGADRALCKSEINTCLIDTVAELLISRRRPVSTC